MYRVGKMPSNKTVSSDFKRDFCLWLLMTSVLASTEEGGGVREINYIYAIPVPLGPGKFQVVVLVQLEL